MLNEEQILKRAYKKGYNTPVRKFGEITQIILPDTRDPKFVPEHGIFEPEDFDEYIGQERPKDLAQIMLQAAKNEGRAIPNMLITGPYGLGKTTLAKLILKGKRYRETSGAVVNNSPNLESYVLIDEIHNLKPDICDRLNTLIDSGRVRIIGCTTNPGLLPGPFRSRFQTLTLTAYTVEDLTQILRNVITRKGTITLSDQALEEVAKRSRSTPRTALRYLSFIMDLMSVKAEEDLSEETLYEAFEKLGVDNLGLTEIDHRYLDALPEDGAAGLQYLTAVLQIDRDTIEQEIEPYLMQLKLIDRSTKGRYKIATLEQQLADFLDEDFKNGPA